MVLSIIIVSFQVQQRIVLLNEAIAVNTSAHITSLVRRKLIMYDEMFTYNNLLLQVDHY